MIEAAALWALLKERGRQPCDVSEAATPDAVEAVTPCTRGGHPTHSQVASFCVRGVAVERISLPGRLSPTCFLAGGECVSEAESRSRQHARPWYVAGVLDAPARLWLVRPSPRLSSPKPQRNLDPNPNPSTDPSPSPNPHPHQVAFASAVPITFFFYMDQNISSLLCQLPKHNLKQGHYYHSSFLWMGLFNAVGPLFGLPFVTGSLPHSPQFVKSLTYTTKRGGQDQHAVAESRMAPLLVYLGIGK